MGLLVAAIGFKPPSQSNQLPGSPLAYKLLLLTASLFYLLPAIWGIVTGIGVWKLKNWARISMIVFSVLLVMTTCFSALMILVIPMPTAPGSPVDSSVMTGIRIGMGVFALSMSAIGIWWLVFFNRAKVKSQFGQVEVRSNSESALEAGYGVPNTHSTPRQAAVPRRPLSVTIIACLMLMGVTCIPLAFWAPATLFTKLLTGLPAALLYIIYGMAAVLIGIGLLRLRPAARLGAIVYYTFACANTIVFYFAPGAHDRMSALLEKEGAVFPWMRALPNQSQVHFDATPFLLIGAVTALLGTIIPIYFLITRKTAFDTSAQHPA
jgi:hypothetical protein